MYFSCLAISEKMCFISSLYPIYNIIFTQHSLVRADELLYFADICAGPGGFSEYILWRKKWEAKGFGFTLKGPCDFKLEEFFAASSEFFEPHYGK